MVHIFTWGLLITAVLVSIWVDKRLDLHQHQFVGQHIVTLIVIVGWVCFMLGLYLGPLIAPRGLLP